MPLLALIHIWLWDLGASPIYTLNCKSKLRKAYKCRILINFNSTRRVGRIRRGLNWIALKLKIWLMGSTKLSKNWVIPNKVRGNQQSSKKTCNLTDQSYNRIKLLQLLKRIPQVGLTYYNNKPDWEKVFRNIVRTGLILMTKQESIYKRNVD